MAVIKALNQVIVILCKIYYSFLDYNLLEDVKRVADSAQRKRAKLCGDYQYRLPLPLKNLGKAAASRRTKIIFLPTGMSKRQTNQSFYHYRYFYNRQLGIYIVNELYWRCNLLFRIMEAICEGGKASVIIVEARIRAMCRLVTQYESRTTHRSMDWFVVDV